MKGSDFMDNDQKVRIELKDMPCPDCGGTLYQKTKSFETIYFCAKFKTPGEYCNKEIYKCTGCNKFYFQDGFGRKGDIYECKICGKTQWDLTEEKRIIDSLRSFRLGFESTVKNMGL